MNNEFEIEQSLLGGLMKLTNDQSDIANYVLHSLKPNSFFARVHAEIYKSIKFLAASNMLFDQLSVASYFHSYCRLVWSVRLLINCCGRVGETHLS